MTSGARLRSLAAQVCSPATMERLIDPILADLQCELAEARRNFGLRHVRWTLLRGYLAFWQAVALQVAISAGRALRASGVSDAGPVSAQPCASVTEAARLSENTESPTQERPMTMSLALAKRIASSLTRHAAGLAIGWLIGFAFVQVAVRSFDGWIAPQIGLTLACALGAAMADKLRASATTLVWMAMTLYGASRFIVQPVFGADAVNGRNNHLFTMGIALAVVAIAALVVYVRPSRARLA